MPEERLPIIMSEVFCKLPAGTTRTRCLQIIDEHRDVEGRMDADQEMHVIGLATKFQ